MTMYELMKEISEKYEAINRKVEKELENWDEPYSLDAVERYCKLTKTTLLRASEALHNSNKDEHFFWYERAKKYEVMMTKLAKKGGLIKEES